MDERISAYRLFIADVFELAGAARRTSEELAATRGQTAARWHVMSAVSEEPATVPAVARRLGQTRQSVQRVANDLVSDGSATFDPNPAHQRSPLLSLTLRGTASLTDLLAVSERSRADVLDRAAVSTHQLDDARAVIKQLLEGLTGPTADPGADGS